MWSLIQEEIRRKKLLAGPPSRRWSPSPPLEPSKIAHHCHPTAHKVRSSRSTRCAFGGANIFLLLLLKLVSMASPALAWHPMSFRVVRTRRIQQQQVGVLPESCPSSFNAPTTPSWIAQPSATHQRIRNNKLQDKLSLTSLYSTPNNNNEDDSDFPEYLDGDNQNSAAPTTEKDNYVTEADLAQQANDVLLRSDGSINHIELETELSNSFLQYALSIILGRAIPDARDGLKPVHRRILFAMQELRLGSGKPHRKCARVVGDVLGKLHPHGDTAVYDALVRLAQDFTSHHPLIDGHGNFGSIDADPAAAMRYTECRLTAFSERALLQDLDVSSDRPGDAVVDVMPTFDGTGTEPVVLPARVPVLLLNGAAGIAVGMATNVPPHNLRELLRACAALADARRPGRARVSTDELLRLVPGPDFPTGAAQLRTGGARQLYTTGHGGIVLRAVTAVEPVGSARRGGAKSATSTRKAIVVTELPYQVNKAALLEKMAALVNEKKLEGIADLRDESSGREGIRVVIELKRDAVVDVVLANLYQKTALQTTFAGNMLALMAPKNDDDAAAGSAGRSSSSNSLVPQRFTLRQALDCFLDFRFATIRRQARLRLAKVDARAHIVEGLLAALEKVDAVIAAVREAASTADAKRVLQQDVLAGLTDLQIDAILRLQLGQLTRLNKGKLQDERADLEESRAQLTRLLTVDEAVYDDMVRDFQELSDTFGVDRRTQIIEADDDGTVEEMDLIQNSRSVIVVTRGGYIKRMPLKTFESQRRGTRGKRGTSATATDEQNEVAQCFTCNDHDTLLMVTDAGIAYGIRAYQVPSSGRLARGHPFPSVLPQLRTVGGTVTSILPVSEFNLPNEYLLLTTEQGWIKKTPLAAFENLSSRGLIIAKLDADDRMRWCKRCRNGDDVLVGTSMGMATRFSADKVRSTGRGSRGVRAMKLRDGDTIADVNVLGGGQHHNGENMDAGLGAEYVLAVSSKGFGKRVAITEFRTQARGGLGVIALKFKASAAGNDRMVCLRSVKDTDEFLVITAKGIMVRQKVSEISSQGRIATGILVQKLDAGDQISSVSIVPEYEESDKLVAKSE